MKTKLILLFLILVSHIYATDLNTKLQQKVSPQFNGASIVEVLNLLARQHALNIVVSDEIKGRVNVRLTNVTLKDALNTILKSRGYHYVIDNDVLLIKGFAENVNGELTSKVFNLKYTNAFFLEATLMQMLSPKGKVVPILDEPTKEESERRGSKIVVTDLWENVNQIAQVVEQLDVLSQQLSIEVRLVETLIGDEQQYGLKLPTRVSASIDGAETNAPITKGKSQNNAARLLSGWYKLPSLGDDITSGILSVEQLEATLDMLAKDNGSRIISNPRITVLNNHKATIRIGTTVPVPEVSRGIAGDLITYKEKDVNIDLKVVPHIGENNKVTLSVHPVLEEIIGYTGDNVAPQPITSKREVNTTVTLDNGNTLVLGGLVKETKTEVSEGIFLLSDIPILGYLFKSTTTKVEKSDLKIFITPIIINTTGLKKK